MRKAGSQTYFNILDHISLHIVLRTLCITSLYLVMIAESRHDCKNFENKKIVEIKELERKVAVEALQTYFNIAGHTSFHILLRTLYIISLHSVMIAEFKHGFNFFVNRKVIEIEGVEGESSCLKCLFPDAIFHFQLLILLSFF